MRALECWHLSSCPDSTGSTRRILELLRRHGSLKVPEVESEAYNNFILHGISH